MLTQMRRISTFWQLFLAFGLMVVGTVVVLGWIVGAWAERSTLQQIEERLRGKAMLLEETVRGRSMDELGPKLRSLHSQLATRITLIASDGRVLFESDRDDLNALDNHGQRPEIVAAKQHAVGVAQRYSATVNKMLLYVARRVEDSGNGIGYVRVALPLTEFEEQAADLRRLIWVMAILTGGAALLLALTVARRIAGPLQDLTRGAAAIAVGKYGHKVYLDRHDEFGALANSFNDMSQRLDDQFRRLDQDRQQLRAVLGSMVEGVIAVDARQNILFANERAGQLLDFSVPLAVGCKLWEVVRHRPIHDLVERLLTSAETDSQSLDWVGPAQRAFTVHAAPLPGRPVPGAVLVLHDVTEMRRLERVRQEFVANVSHELKTPLSVIVACAETLQNGALDDVENRGKFLERIATQSQRLLTLIVDMIDLARIEAGTEEFKRDEVAIEAAVNACIERHQERARAKNQRLEAVPPAQAPPGGVTAWTDEDALRQILDNLVDNAIKYTPAEGLIQLHWWAEDRHAVVEVRDTGIGIPEHEVPRVFERFYRVDKARSREMGGTGLGLSIVKHIVQAMGGSVRVTSQPGQGTSFTVLLPQNPQK